MRDKDEDILSSTALIKKGLVIDRLLENLIISDIDPTTLLVGDRNAIMIAARISSYGASYKATVRCPSCVNTVEYVFDLKKTNMVDFCFNEEFLRNNKSVFNNQNKHFEFDLPISNVKVGIRPLTGKDEKTLSDLDQTQLITSTLSSFIVSVNDDVEDTTIQSFIENMPAGDSKHVRDLYPKLVPNIDLKQDFVCENCVHHVEMEVPLTAEFFWPG